LSPVRLGQLQSSCDGLEVTFDDDIAPDGTADVDGHGLEGKVVSSNRTCSARSFRHRGDNSLRSVGVCSVGGAAVVARAEFRN